MDDIDEQISYKYRGTLEDEYKIYVNCVNDGKRIDITTGKKIKTFDEWLNEN